MVRNEKLTEERYRGGMVYKTSLLAAFLSVISAAPASASPISLDCYVFDIKYNSRDEFQIELNEENKTATYTLPNGKVISRVAVFTPMKVHFSDGAFTIDRVTMAFSRRKIFGGMDLGTDYGKCSVMTTKRAF